MRVRLIVLSGIAYLLALTGCDTARNLVEPIDTGPIETTGETKFAVTIKPVGEGYQTTIRLTDIVILDNKGNELPITSIDDIVVNTDGDVTTPESRDVWWLKDMVSKNPSLKDYDCDNHNAFNDGTDSDNRYWHHHAIEREHSHNHRRRGHYHDNGQMKEDPPSVLPGPDDSKHRHTIWIWHTHVHKWEPPKPFHTHKCR